MKLLYYILIGLMIVLLLMQHIFFGGISLELFSEMVPNLLTELIAIIVTLTIVERIITSHKRNEEVKIIKQVLGNRYKELVNSISIKFIHFVTKKPITFSGSYPETDHLKNTVYNINSNLETYVRSDFVKTPITVNIINPQNIFSHEVKLIEYQAFCEKMFKEEVNKSISDFVNQYISILPSDIMKSLFKINDLLNSYILVTPLQHGLLMNISNAQFNPSDFRYVLKSIGLEIEKLQRYC